MFGYGRRRSHGQLAKAELGQSFNHLRQAASHAAGGVGASLGPRVHNARGYMTPATARVRKTATDGWLSTTARLAPLAVAATSGAKQAGSMSRSAKMKSQQMKGKRKASRASRRWPLMLAAGAAVGAVAAKAMRRRREQEWESYDPSLALETARSGEVPPPTATQAPPTASQAAQSGEAQASLAAEQKSAMGRSSGPTEKATSGRTVDKNESAVSNTGPASRNGRA